MYQTMYQIRMFSEFSTKLHTIKTILKNNLFMFLRLRVPSVYDRWCQKQIVKTDGYELTTRSTLYPTFYIFQKHMLRAYFLIVHIFFGY